MIDLNWTQLSLGLSLFFNAIFFLYVFSFYNKCVSFPKWQQTKVNYLLLFYSLLLIVVVSTGNYSDWFSYQEIVWNYDFRLGSINHGEPVYAYIVKFVNRNYLLFRIIVWGGAFLLTCLTLKRFEVNVNVAAFLLVSAFLTKFNYGRSTLAMANYFLGLSFLFKPIKKLKILSIIFAAICFWGTYEFHHSLLPVLFLTILAYIPLKKWYLLIIIILLPFLASYMSSHFEIIYNIGNDDISSKFESYVNKTTDSGNILGIIMSIINYSSMIIPIIIISFSIDKHRNSIELPLLRLYRVVIIIFFFAASFLFMGLNSEFFVLRYMFVIIIPITILSVYLFGKGLLNKRRFSTIVLIGTVYNAISLIVCLTHNM